MRFKTSTLIRLHKQLFQAAPMSQTEYTSFYDNVAHLNRQIFAEDARICELVQKGTALSAYHIYNSQENELLLFINIMKLSLKKKHYENYLHPCGH